MKKAPLLITTGILALSVLAYFSYNQFVNSSKVSGWDLIPSNAVAVYEVSTCSECISPVSQSSLWYIIHEAAFFEKGNDSIRNIISAISQPKANSLISLHITKKDDFDFVFYIPFQNENEKKLYETLLEGWKQNEQTKYRERIFNTIKIQELYMDESIFSWVSLDDMLVASFTPFLIEDVIRVHKGQTSTTFKEELAQVSMMNRIKQDAGNVYVHMKNFSDWLTVFVPDQDLRIVEHFGKASLLDIRAEEGNIVLNGFSVEDAKGTSILSVFNAQSPTSFDLKHYVSNRTVMFTCYGISDGVSFGQRLNSYPGRPQSAKDTLAQLSKSLHVDFESLYNKIDDEIGLCYVETGGKELSKVLLLETNNSHDWLNQFGKVGEQLSIDTIFLDKFSDYEIRELPIFRFSEKLFAPFITGFDHTYYTTLGNVIIMAEDVDQLKRFLDDIDKEETWGKTVAQNQFLKSTLLESNVSLYINTPRTWNILSGMVSEKWKKFIRINQTRLNAIGMGAVQFSHLNSSYYTNVSWHNTPYKEVVPITPLKTETLITTINAPIIGNHFVVKNHNDKKFETLLQDSLERIHLLSTEGSELWSLQMNGPIIGDVVQIDYYKNGKLQYFFATPGRLHIIDRLGNYVSPFPVNVASKEIDYVKVIDYDHSKNYRFLLSDPSGKLWMYDKNGENLEGWSPRNVEDDLMASARHYRIRAKDIIVAIRTDGRVYLMNRKGELMRGFPLNLDARPTGDFFLEQGNSWSDTYLVLVSKDGYRIEFDLDGSVHKRETLIKQSIDTRFMLVLEHENKSYVIVRQSPTGLTILDKNNNEIFTNDFLGLNQVQIDYYDFGAGKIYYVITDVGQELTYIYDTNGTLITSPPIESHRVTLRMSKDDNIVLYITYDNSLQIKTLH